MPIADDFDVDWVLENSYGFVGADLAALVRESAMKALRRYLPEIDLDEETIPPEVLEKMEVRMDDFRLAIRESSQVHSERYMSKSLMFHGRVLAAFPKSKTA